jgi:hypothetical protein
MTRRVLPLVAVVLLVNLVMLLSARANRAGEPESVLELTERELRLERASDRDSAQRLRIDPSNRSGFILGTLARQQDWLTEAKLSALGFGCRRTDGVAGKAPRMQSCGLPRRAFAVYEYDGSAWRSVAAALQRRREEASSAADAAKPYSSATMLDNQIRYGSRLVAVDVSSDAASLRRAYPDRHRYLILPARVRAWLEPASPPAVPALHGFVDPLTISLVAPSAFRDRLVAFGPSTGLPDKEPRYTVIVATGRHYETWILAIDPIDSPVPPH